MFLFLQGLFSDFPYITRTNHIKNYDVKVISHK